MTEQSIDSEDMTLKRLFQDFYRVPDYQREYVWGETNPKGEGGEEVEQFLNDIFNEYDNATKSDAPEYFIGTIVVCRGKDDVFELIDGQQRTTTSYLTLCAIRDAIEELEEAVPEELKSQIAASTVDWQGESVERYRLDLQYEDSGDILKEIADGKAMEAETDGTRSIRNISNAYQTVREFLKVTLEDDPAAIRRFHGYLTNKVKIIRIETPTIAKALKIFETINDRGVGLDAMDLLKNLLFMNTKESDFQKLKDIWKKLTDEIYTAREKPLRFLRYYLLATYNVDNKLREDDIYDWFQKNEKQTSHAANPIKFASGLLKGAEAYRHFVHDEDVVGNHVRALANTRLLGGQTIKQHFIVLLAGRHLDRESFADLCREIENTMCVWLITGKTAKEYERTIVRVARDIRSISGDELEEFLQSNLAPERAKLQKDFKETLEEIGFWDLRRFRLRYLVGKMTQYVDLEAYGESEGRNSLAEYVGGNNDIEHILATDPSKKAAEEFGEGAGDWEIDSLLGNLVLLERSINRSIGNEPYSEKKSKYQQSKFLLTKCVPDADAAKIGTADMITKAAKRLPSFDTWNYEQIVSRQKFLAKLALEIWQVPEKA